jgi:cob(I)alamin adenosyltransferase
MVYLSRIYTKSGDLGETGLGDGQRVSKDHSRITACGEVDELNATMGFVVLHAGPEVVCELTRIQNELFDLGADLCVPVTDNEEPGKCLRMTAEQTAWMETSIDQMNEHLQPLRSFILPGGSPLATWLHLARTVCRRAERALVTLCREAAINPHALTYINRLSDYLFVLARIANENGTRDVLWIPGASRGG